MMDDQAVFSVLAQCFGPIDETDWIELTSREIWSDFIFSLEDLMQEERPLGQAPRASRASISRGSLRDFLSENEVKALIHPPTYEEKAHFEAMHFTGGLPTSAMPVESLYRRPRQDAQNMLNAQKSDRMYLGESAEYVKHVAGDLGLNIPEGLAAMPDHLSLELDMIAVLLRSGLQQEARTFLMERFSWLSEYRKKLLQLEDAEFYIALLDIILGIRARQETLGYEYHLISIQ